MREADAGGRYAEREEHMTTDIVLVGDVADLGNHLTKDSVAEVAISKVSAGVEIEVTADSKTENVVHREREEVPFLESDTVGTEHSVTTLLGGPASGMLEEILDRYFKKPLVSYGAVFVVVEDTRGAEDLLVEREPTFLDEVHDSDSSHKF